MIFIAKNWQCYAWDAETIDSSKSFQSLQSFIEAKKFKSFVSSNTFVRHFIIGQNSTFFLLFGDFEDDTEVIDSIFFYFRVETKGLSYGLFFTWPKNVRDMSRIPHKINDNWRRWPSLPSAAAAVSTECCFTVAASTFFAKKQMPFSVIILSNPLFYFSRRRMNFNLDRFWSKDDINLTTSST